MKKCTTDIGTTFADPKVDMTFKILLGDQSNKIILINFLNSMLNFTGLQAIKDVTLSPTNLPKSGIDEISSELDILCKTGNNKQINIEMQRQSSINFLPRIQYYMSRLIGKKVKIGEEYKNIHETYILVIGEKKFPGFCPEMYEHHYAPCNLKTNTLMPYNKMYWVIFELEKFKTQVNQERIKEEIKLQWLHFFANCGSENRVPEFITDENIKNSYNIMYNIFQNTELKARYENSLARAQERNNFYEKRGEKRGEIKGEIVKIQDFKKLGINPSKIYNINYKYLKTNHIKKILEEKDWDTLSSTAIFEALQKEYPKIIEELS